jgi:hypothetical protein
MVDYVGNVNVADAIFVVVIMAMGHELTRACERKVSGFTATQVVECHLLRT